MNVNDALGKLTGGTCSLKDITFDVPIKGRMSHFVSINITLGGECKDIILQNYKREFVSETIDEVRSKNSGHIVIVKYDPIANSRENTLTDNGNGDYFISGSFEYFMKTFKSLYANREKKFPGSPWFVVMLDVEKEVPDWSGRVWIVGSGIRELLTADDDSGIHTLVTVADYGLLSAALGEPDSTGRTLILDCGGEGWPEIIYK